MTTHSKHVYDVEDATFQAAVIDRSHTVPVVVDFWAPWCGPCRQLGPLLERLADQYDGQFELAKLNTDENPSTSQAFRIEGIPAVKAFKDGRMVTEFTGALPESQVRAFLTRILPSEADRMAQRADELAAAGHVNAAEDSYREALSKQAVHSGAAVGLARLLANRGEEDEALRILSTYPNDASANQLRAEIGLRKANGSTDRKELEERLAADPKDVEANYQLGMALAAEGDYDPAFEHMLAVVRLDRGYGEDAGRKAMLDLFNLLGDESPLTQRYRKQLSYLLF
jgi:putative thioredoxin